MSSLRTTFVSHAKGAIPSSCGRKPANQLRLVVCPIILRVLYIPGGAGFLPSTVWNNLRLAVIIVYACLGTTQIKPVIYTNQIFIWILKHHTRCHEPFTKATNKTRGSFKHQGVYIPTLKCRNLLWTSITTWFHDPSSNSYPRDSPLLHPIVTKVSGFFRPRLKVCPLHTVLGFSSYQNAPLGFQDVDMFLLHLISFTNTTPTSELLIETAFPRGNEQIANHGLRIDEENVGRLVCVFFVQVSWSSHVWDQIFKS